MGDRYEMSLECPNCNSDIWCYYAESCEVTRVKCPNCERRFKIVMEFKLVEEDK